MKNIIRVLAMLYLIMYIPSVKPVQGQLSQLDKIFHHKSNSGPSVELGSVIFYFSKNPKVNSLSKRKTPSGQFIHTFFFPSVQVKNRSVKQMIDVFNATRGQGSPYRVSVAVVEKPNPGIRFVITYDENKVNVAYDTFESIGLKKGVIFRLYNKELLNKLKKQSSPIMRMACKKGVVIDCGHGGHDPGTEGFDSIKEKDVTLGIGLKVARLLRSKGIKVFLTRSKDQYLFLDQRTSCANTWNKANAFVSIHANYSSNNNVSGIETYCLKNNLFNACFSELSNELASIQKKIVHNVRQHSNALAAHIQQTAVTHAQTKNPYALNRKVKYAVSQVLAGTTMPSALIEVGFVSHPYEGKLLASKEYQQVLAKGISDGIIAYLKGVTS